MSSQAIFSAADALGVPFAGPIGSVVDLFGGGGKPGLPQAQSVVTKWYVWYMRRAPDTQGLHHWIDQINGAAGMAGAWRDFSGSAEPMQVGAAQYADLYQSLGYGGPLDDVGYANAQVAPPTDQVKSTATPASAAPTAPSSAPMVGGGAFPSSPPPSAYTPRWQRPPAAAIPSGPPAAVVPQAGAPPVHPKWYMTPIGIGVMVGGALLLLVVLKRKKVI